MKSMRSLIGIVLAFALATFAAPGFAQNTKLFAAYWQTSDTVTPPYSALNTIEVGVTKTGRMKLYNATPTGNSSPNVFQLVSPLGVKIVDVGDIDAAYDIKSKVLGTRPDGRSFATIVVNSTIAKQTDFDVTVTIEGTCGSTDGNWDVIAKTGADITGGQAFSCTTPTSANGLPSFADYTAACPFNTAVTNNGAGASIRFLEGRTPKSATLVSGLATVTSVANDPAGPGVQVEVLKGACRDTSYNGSVSINIVKYNGTPYAGLPAITLGNVPVNAVQGLATFGIPSGNPAFTLNVAGGYELQASAPSPLSVSSAPVSLLISDGTLACAASGFSALQIPAYDPDDPSTFDASPPLVDGTEDTAFLAGARGRGDLTKDNCSADINFAVVNNIPVDSVARTDPLGNVVPNGGWSFTWDEQIALNPVIGVITTYRSEWGDAVTGLPTNSTWICKTRPCPGSRSAFPDDWKKLESCLGTAVTHASVPDGEVACLVQEVWTVLDVGDAAYCTTLPPDKPSTAPDGWKPRCLQPTSITIIGQDPVFER